MITPSLRFMRSTGGKKYHLFQAIKSKRKLSRLICCCKWSQLHYLLWLFCTTRGRCRAAAQFLSTGRCQPKTYLCSFCPLFILWVQRTRQHYLETMLIQEFNPIIGLFLYILAYLKKVNGGPLSLNHILVS